MNVNKLYDYILIDISLGGAELTSSPATNSNDYYWDGKYVSFSNHAKHELENYDMDTINLMDMLHGSFPCKKKKRHS